MASSRFCRLATQIVLGAIIVSSSIVVKALEQEKIVSTTSGAYETGAPHVSSTWISPSNKDSSHDQEHMTTSPHREELDDKTAYHRAAPTVEDHSSIQYHIPEQDSDILQHHIKNNFVAGYKRYQQHLRTRAAVKEDARAAASSKAHGQEEGSTVRRLEEEPMVPDGQQMRFQAVRTTSAIPSDNIIKEADTAMFERFVEENMLAGQDRYHVVHASKQAKEQQGNSNHHTDRDESGRKRPPPRPKVSPPLLLPKPVMVVGFPKAGTSSIFSFFHCSGLKSMHWFCCGEQSDPQFGGPQLMSGCMLRNLANQFPILHKCGDYEVFAELNGPRKAMINATGHSGILLDDGTYDFEGPGSRVLLPQHHYLADIDKQYPEATFILNLRPVKDWVASVLRWKDDLAHQLVNEYHVQSGGIIKRPRNDSEMALFLTEIYTNHTTMIRKFVKDHPSHALVEVDITDPHAGELLADSFGLDATCWKHVNSNPMTTTSRVD